MWRVLLPYWFMQRDNTMDSSILLDNLISPPLSHPHFLPWFSSFLFRRPASLSSLIHTQAFQNKARNSCSVCEGRKVTLGDDRGTKTWERWRERERGGERMRGSIEGRLGGKGRREGRHGSWHRDIIWLIKGQHASLQSHIRKKRKTKCGMITLVFSTTVGPEDSYNTAPAHLTVRMSSCLGVIQNTHRIANK